MSLMCSGRGAVTRKRGAASAGKGTGRKRASLKSEHGLRKPLPHPTRHKGVKVSGEPPEEPETLTTEGMRKFCDTWDPKLKEFTTEAYGQGDIIDEEGPMRSTRARTARARTVFAQLSSKRCESARLHTVAFVARTLCMYARGIAASASWSTS